MMRELYQEVIMDHNKQPRNKGRLESPTTSAEGFNPLCGDQIDLQVQVEGGVIVDVAFEGHGCAIDTASASLMTQAIKGKSVDDVQAMVADFLQLAMGEADPDLGKLNVLAGVREFPARVKCATLPWRTLEQALAGGGEVTTE